MTGTFEYYAPADVDTALALLASRPCKLIAGGTDVLVQMQEGQLSPENLVDIGGIPALQGIQAHPHEVCVGAAVTHSQMARWAGKAAAYGALAQACASVGTPQVRNRATVVGNLCNAVPSADLAAPVLLFGAEVVILSARGERRVPAKAFFTGPKKTVLLPDELVSAVLFKPPPAKSASAYSKLGPRKASDLATVGVAALLALAEDGAVEALRIGLNAVSPTPMLVRGCDELAGRPFSRQLAEECAALAEETCRPITDYRASAGYRKDMVQTLTQKTLLACAVKLGKDGL